MRTTAKYGRCGPAHESWFRWRLRSDGQLPAMRNSIPVPELLDWVYKGNGLLQEQVPADRLPSLLPRVRPIHEVVNVDVFFRDVHLLPIRSSRHQRVTCRPRSGRSCLSRFGV